MQELGRQPTIAEIARRVERPVSSVALCLRKTQKPHAMDAAPTDSEKDSMVDLIVSAGDEQPSSLHDLMHRSGVLTADTHVMLACSAAWMLLPTDTAKNRKLDLIVSADNE